MVMKTHTAVLQAMTPCCLVNDSVSEKHLKRWRPFELVVPTYHFAWFLYLKDHNMKVNIVLACAQSLYFVHCMKLLLSKYKDYERTTTVWHT